MSYEKFKKVVHILFSFSLENCMVSSIISVTSVEISFLVPIFVELYRDVE
jgi:hypothetical protein